MDYNFVFLIISICVFLITLAINISVFKNRRNESSKDAGTLYIIKDDVDGDIYPFAEFTMPLEEIMKCDCITMKVSQKK